MPTIKGRLTYKGFISPAPKKTDTPKQKKELAKIYGGCRYSFVQKNPKLREDKGNKSFCSRIARSISEK